MDDDYKFPPIELLKRSNMNVNKEVLNQNKEIIEKTLKTFDAEAKVKEIIPGNIVTRYYLKPSIGVTVKKIKNLTPELQYNLGVKRLNMECMGEKQSVAFDIVNEQRRVLRLRECIENAKKTDGIPIIIGKDFDGKVISENLIELPNLIIAGTTGTGKSNLLSSFIINILYNMSPSELGMVLIDTRKTNFYKFEKIPHLITPIINNAPRAIEVLKNLIDEMYKRYELFKENNVDNIDSYNKIATEKIKRIVLIIEDFYDLMLYTDGIIEKYIQILTQMSRKIGINIIISTQRPSTNVLTGTIKANMPARISFLLPSNIDSKTVLDTSGAERLLRNGEILFTKIEKRKTMKLQTPYITENEINKVVKYIENNKFETNENFNNVLKSTDFSNTIRENKFNKTSIIEDEIKANITEEINKYETSKCEDEKDINNVGDDINNESIFSKWYFWILSIIFFLTIIYSIF